MNENSPKSSSKTYTIGVNTYNNIVDNRLYTIADYRAHVWDMIVQITNNRELLCVDEFLYTTFITELTPEELIMLKLKLENAAIAPVDCDIYTARDQVVNNITIRIHN